MINLSRNKNICCGLKKVVAKSRARVYFEQQILVLFLVFHQTHNLSGNKFARARANQPIIALHFFNPQQMFLLRIKLIAPGEKRETSTKTCNETMLRDKLRIFVSRISPPLRREISLVMTAPHGDLACDDIGVYMDFSSQPIGILEFTYNTYLGLPCRVFQGRNVKISDGKKYYWNVSI